MLQTVALTRPSLARFAESPAVPDEDFLRVLSKYFALPSAVGAAAYAAPEAGVGQVSAASSL